MGYLIIVALIQAFSFNLIGEYLAGQVDSYFAVLARVVLALLVFLPLTRWREVEPRFMRSMLLIGALQYGITYVCLYLSFRVLTVPEVLLFTILTPLHVTLIEDALNRRFNPWALLAALVAVAGAAVIRFDSVTGEFFIGFLLLQLANFTYAAGQVLYRHLVARHPSALPHYKRFGYFYLGALLVVLPAFLLFGNAQHLPSTDTQWLVLLFLAGADGAGAVLVEQGRMPGFRRHPGGDEQPACAGGAAAEPADLEPGRAAGAAGHRRRDHLGVGVDEPAGRAGQGVARPTLT